MASVVAACLVLFLKVPSLCASGSVGIYGIVERVIFEPNDQAPERIQVWGAFAFAEGDGQTVSPVKRGYLYFKLPPGNGRALENVKTEWMDLKAVAGTGQAIAFGRWGYIGGFDGLQSDGRTATSTKPPYTLGPTEGYPSWTDVRVRPESESLNPPATYVTNIGIVKLAADGNHAEVVKKLKESLKR